MLSFYLLFLFYPSILLLSVVPDLFPALFPTYVFSPLWRVFQSNIIKILESQSQRRMQACLVQAHIQHINCATIFCSLCLKSPEMRHSHPLEVAHLIVKMKRVLI